MAFTQANFSGNSHLNVYNHNIPYVNTFNPVGSNMFGEVIGGLFGAAEAGINYAASKYAADKQYEAQIETNKANAELAAKQNEWNIEQWNRNNEYNTAAAQSARYQHAGINPALAMQAGQMSAGNSSAPAQQAPLPHMEAPEVRAPQLDMSPIFQNIMTAKLMQKEDKEIEARELDNTLSRMTLFDRAHSIKSKARSDDHKAVIDGVMADIAKGTKDATIDNAVVNNEILRTQAKTALHNSVIAEINASAAKLRLDNLPEQIKQELALLTERVIYQQALTDSTKRMTEQNIKESASRIRANLASAFLSYRSGSAQPLFSEEQAKGLAQNIINTGQWTADKAYYDAGTADINQQKETQELFYLTNGRNAREASLSRIRRGVASPFDYYNLYQLDRKEGNIPFSFTTPYGGISY